MKLIDTHCHINDAEGFPDVAATIEDAGESGVERIIVIGVDAESSIRAVELADSYEGVYAVVGWHPNYCSKYSPAGLDQIARLLQHPKCVALGEIGLDFHWNYASLEEQERALMDQLALAKKIGKPVVLHCREAYPALLTKLEAHEPMPLLFHCFMGDSADAARALALGCYFGVDGPITYKKSDSLREVIGSLPRDRVVIETDSPYLSPEPYRGRPNRPSLVRHVNAGLAKVWGIDPEECANLTTANAERFFRLL